MNVENKKKIFTLLSKGHQQHCWLKSSHDAAETGGCTCIIGQAEALLSEEDQTHNINDRVKVELTDEGRTVLRVHESEVTRLFSRPLGQEVINSFRHQEVSGEFQLHELMNIFGPRCIIGGPQVFTGNTLRFIR